MKKCLFYIFLFSFNLIFSQDGLDIEKAIDLALTNSDTYKKAEKELVYSGVNTTIFNKTFLPSIYTSSVFPSISQSVTRVTTPDGTDVFVNQNLAYYDLSLNIEQKEPVFGGTFTVSSFFNRIDLFGDVSNKTYFSTPFSLSYSNTNFVFNIHKYEKLIEQLRIKENAVNYNIQLENVAYETVEKYFDAYIVNRNIKEKQKGLKDIEVIYAIAEKRFKIGSINKGDLLSLELNKLDTKSSLDALLSEKQNSEKALSNFIQNNSNSIIFVKPKEDILNLDISYESAVREMSENNKLIIELKRKQKEKDLEIKRFKSENKFSVNINASYGLSNTAPTFNQSTNNLQDQQLFSISLRYLLFDFGKNKQQIKLMNIEKELLENEYLIAIEELKENLYNSVNQYHTGIERLAFLKKKLEISNERYDFTRKRFSLGKVTITDLNVAQREYQQTDNEYLTTLKDIWITYYNIRKLTMYDFQKSEKINYL